MSALRIVSLVPSLTELVVDLGLADALVGRTGFCIHPRDVVADLPKVGGTKDVRVERVRELAPTHVLVNVDENDAGTVMALSRFVPQLVVTHPCDPADNLALYAQMAEVFAAQPGVAERAQALATALQERLDTLATATWPQRRVLYLIWRDPWMTVARDTYISRMLARVGWQTWPDVDGGHSGAMRYPAVDWSEVRKERPDIVLLSTEPFRFEPRHVAEVRRLCPRTAVRMVDGERLSWYGSRAIRGLDYLSALADPDGMG